MVVEEEKDKVEEEEEDKVEEEEEDKMEEEEDKVDEVEEEVCNIPLENSLTCGFGPRRIPQRPSHTLAAPSLQTFLKSIRKIQIQIQSHTLAAPSLQTC